MYRSQCGQDRLVERLFKGMRGGFFVELGGMDGLKFSNTSYLEEALEWTGILIEPNPHLYSKMVSNRPRSIHKSCAIASPESPDTLTLRVPKACPGLAGLQDFYPKAHTQRIMRENGGSTGEEHTVRVCTMEYVLNEHGVKEVHYMSIDVEGAEAEVIAGINFDHTFIHLIGFEANYPGPANKLREKLEKLGFRRISTQGNDIFMANEKSTILFPS